MPHQLAAADRVAIENGLRPGEKMQCHRKGVECGQKHHQKRGLQASPDKRQGRQRTSFKQVCQATFMHKTLCMQCHRKGAECGQKHHQKRGPQASPDKRQRRQRTPFKQVCQATFMHETLCMQPMQQTISRQKMQSLLRCNDACPAFVKSICASPEKPSYACNGCAEEFKCVLRKMFYKAAVARGEQS